MSEIFLKFILGYLAGSLVGSLLVGRARGIDIRTLGSGNAGSTNALRTQGKLFALPVILIDVLKVVLPVLWLTDAALPGIGMAFTGPRQTVAVAIAAGAVAGHVWPLYFGFRGGKGMATLLGAYGAIQLSLLLPVMLTWILLLLLLGYVGLATVVAAAAAPAWLAATGQAGQPLFWFALVMAAFVLWTHRDNLARMRAGTENRFGRQVGPRR